MKVRLLNKSGMGKEKSLPAPAAELLIKRGMAEAIEEKPKAKPKAKK